MNETKPQKLERLEREHLAMVDALRRIVQASYDGTTDYPSAIGRMSGIAEGVLRFSTKAGLDETTQAAMDANKRPRRSLSLAVSA